MTDRMAMAILRLLIAMARHHATGNRAALLKEADRAEQAANERARIS